MSKLKVFLLCNKDLTTNIIFSPMFSMHNIEVVGLGLTLTLSKNKGGASGALQILKKTDYRYWLFLVFVNGFFALNRYAPFSSKYLFPISQQLVKLAHQKSVPVYESANFNSKEFLKILHDSRVDLLLIRVNQILSAELLQIPRIATWCVHSSLLPAYKGIAGEFHALNNNEKELGSSIFKVIPALDQGQVLFQTRFTPDKKKSLFHHITTNNQKAADLLQQKVLELNENRLTTDNIIQKNDSYFSWPTSRQVDNFLNHYRLISLREALSFAFKSLFFK